MIEFVTFSGAGSVSNLIVPVGSSSCVSVLAGAQDIYSQVVTGSDTAKSCSATPISNGVQIIWSSGAIWTVSSTGTANSDGFFSDQFDPVVGGTLFGTVVSSILILYICSRSAGTILNFIRGR